MCQRLGRPPVLRAAGGVRLVNTRFIATLAVAAMLLGQLSALGCAGASAHDVAEETLEEERAPRPPLTIYRSELTPLLERGLQPLIAELDLRPVVEDGARFLGWRVLFLKPQKSPFKESSVRPGDIVKRVNEEPIERPDQMMKVWKSLATADQLKFSILRGGVPMEITYQIR